MLTHLQIQNFIIIEKLDLDFEKGLTVITGETGAGKSIVIDALSLILGARADSSVVGNSQDKCDLSACFNIEDIPEAVKWLSEQEYGEEPWNECIIRRVINKEGKSRQMINGYHCTAAQLKDFLPLLINIHSQNQQQLLIKRQHQRELLDSFSNHLELCDEVKTNFQLWSENQKKMRSLFQVQQNIEVQQELLEYQIQEFDKIALLPDEYDSLDKEHKQLSNAGQIIKNCQDALNHLSEIEKTSAQDRLYQANNLLQGIEHYDEKIAAANELINNSIIHLEEATSELRSYLNQVEVNPDRLNEVEKRLSKLHDLARKYQTSPQVLEAIHQDLKKQLGELKEADKQYEILKQKSGALEDAYRQSASKLNKSRQKAAKILNAQITSEIQNLGMPGGVFQVVINSTEDFTPLGSDEIEFQVATNPGQSLQPLTKVASGGEISRIALAIYVATAQRKTTPILVFDEVDVGIGGGTAAIVGKLLKALAKSAQVLCITHLPQVAAYGDQHFCVQKQVAANQTATRIVELKDKSRIEEIARMLGGITITEKTLAHAKELILME